MRLLVIVYDIADDRRRQRLAGVLGRRGKRVQESAFEAWLSGAELRALLAEVAAVIEPAADAVRAYPLAPRALLAAAIDASSDRVALYVLAPADQRDALSLGRGLPVDDFRHALL
ncbi:MAG: CRISPR-associated endonuclease Cas2 2 [Candidatus Accumulibacter adjunctus]|uniref:CRISPR-associated endoribonuclease Cas2 n=1 Tax=Candidatus Accumulibacter adjunctus TaxID=1454001 RepID=A0A011NWJ3_9PROT|nr:MAG: CRISPR-associated endonuclease Cas2 2 [Candidatus Accumulibacter adjunctus]